MDEAAGDEREPQKQEACNSVPEKVECPVCEGAGEIAFDEDEWELQIVADEDEHLEE
jgi:rubredoxin